MVVLIFGIGVTLVLALVLWALCAHGTTALLRLIGIAPLLAAFEVIFLQANAELEFRLKRAVLANNLFTLREVAAEFTATWGRPPTALTDLVAAGYLKQIPMNPFTGKTDWQTSVVESGSGVRAEFQVFADGEEPKPPVDSTTKAAIVFGTLGAVCLVGARLCARLQSRMATSILVLGLNLVGYISLFSGLLVALVVWKGLSRS